jgi:hypothetical protein
LEKVATKVRSQKKQDVDELNQAEQDEGRLTRTGDTWAVEKGKWDSNGKWVKEGEDTVLATALNKSDRDWNIEEFARVMRFVDRREQLLTKIGPKKCTVRFIDRIKGLLTTIAPKKCTHAIRQRSCNKAVTSNDATEACCCCLPIRAFTKSLDTRLMQIADTEDRIMRGETIVTKDAFVRLFFERYRYGTVRRVDTHTWTVTDGVDKLGGDWGQHDTWGWVLCDTLMKDEAERTERENSAVLEWVERRERMLREATGVKQKKETDQYDPARPMQTVLERRERVLREATGVKQKKEADQYDPARPMQTVLEWIHDAGERARPQELKEGKSWRDDGSLVQAEQFTGRLVREKDKWRVERGKFNSKGQ